MRVTEVMQGVRLVVPVIEVVIDLHGPGQSGDSLDRLAQVLVDDAQAVQRRGLTAEVAGLAVQAQRLLAVRERRTVVAELRMAPPDAVERTGLPDAVTNRPEQDHRALVVG